MKITRLIVVLLGFATGLLAQGTQLASFWCYPQNCVDTTLVPAGAADSVVVQANELCYNGNRPTRDAGVYVFQCAGAVSIFAEGYWDSFYRLSDLGEIYRVDEVVAYADAEAWYLLGRYFEAFRLQDCEGGVQEFIDNPVPC